MIHLRDWSHTSLGTAIELFACKELAELASEAPILLIGGVHGDEPLGVELARRTLHYLQAETRKSPDRVIPWVVIPILNVDGFHKDTRVNGRGVDLNRNYPAQSWSPEFEKERYHPGTGPASEPEIQSLVALIQQIKPRLMIHCHSWHPMIVCAGEPGMMAAQALGESSGYKVVPEIGYPTPGSLSQYGWADHKIPVICIEEDDDAKTDEVWPRFADGMKRVFEKS